MIEVRTVRITWFVETGYTDTVGMGCWDIPAESVPCDTESEAHDLRDRWLSEGKLVRDKWGELRPTFKYGMFRIRRHEEITDVREEL